MAEKKMDPLDPLSAQRVPPGATRLLYPLDGWHYEQYGQGLLPVRRLPAPVRFDMCSYCCILWQKEARRRWDANKLCYGPCGTVEVQGCKPGMDYLTRGVHLVKDWETAVALAKWWENLAWETKT